MKIASYMNRGKNSYGVVDGNQIIDLPLLFKSQGKIDYPIDVLSLIGSGDEGANAVKSAISNAKRNHDSSVLSGDSVDFLPPIFNPPKFFCIGRNYAEHAKEAGFDMSPIPIMFHRFASTLIGHGADILYPKVSHELDWEGELAVVIGRSHKGQIPTEKAMDYVFGYTAFNDVTVRNYQFRTTQYIAGKNFRTSGPLGPVIVTKDELSNPHGVQIVTTVNDIVMQNANTSTMHFDIPFIINHLSEFIDLQAGDVIAMGTPAGVGFKRKPPIWLNIGDTVTIEIEGIGKLTNKVVEDN